MLPGTGIPGFLSVWQLPAQGVCNLQQFDGLTRLTLTPIFYHRSTSLVEANNDNYAPSSNSSNVQ